MITLIVLKERINKLFYNKMDLQNAVGTSTKPYFYALWSAVSGIPQLQLVQRVLCRMELLILLVVAILALTSWRRTTRTKLK